MDSSYPGAVLGAALQGLLTGAWIAAAELPVRDRRLVRAGSVVTLSVLASVGDKGARNAPDEERAPLRFAEADKRRLAVSAVVIGAAVGRWQLEKRWVAALARDGHPHPHRALAVRMGLLSFAGTLPGRLLKVHERRKGL